MLDIFDGKRLFIADSATYFLDFQVFKRKTLAKTRAFMERIRLLIKHLSQTMHENMRYHQKGLIMVGWIAVIGYPLYYYIWTYVFPQTYDSLAIRIFTGLLCLPLIFIRQLPPSFEKILPWYWHIGLIYSLPFSATYLMLMNQASDVWLACEVIMIFLVIMFAIDWLLIFLIIGIGTISGYWFYMIVAENPEVPWGKLLEFSPLFFFALIGGGIFNLSFKEGISNQKKLEGTAKLGSTVAHELRTPLASIRAINYGFNERLKDLVAKIREKNLGNEIEVYDMFELSKDIEEEVSHSNAIIDMMLVSVKGGRPKSSEFVDIRISELLNKTLDRYPFTVIDDRNKIHIEIEHDFIFKGSELLSIHMLFNLIRNAFYFIAKARKGEIYIRTKIDDDYNILIFKDTGYGIPSNQLKYIFNQFYTTTFEGTGLGLYFCQSAMKEFSGKIYCHSAFGKYTEFTLYFPKVLENNSVNK